MKSRSAQSFNIVSVCIALLIFIGISVPMASAAPKTPAVIVHLKDPAKVNALGQKHGFSVKKSLVRGSERTLIVTHADPNGLAKSLKQDPDVDWVEVDHPLYRLGETVLPLGETVLPLGETVLPLGETVLPLGETVLPLNTVNSLLGTTVSLAQQSIVSSGYSILASLITPSGRFLIQPAFYKIGLYRAVSLSRGRGAKVAVIDTGVDTCHETLQGIAFFSFVADPNAENCPSPGAIQPPGFGHGTAVTSLIRAVAPQASISMLQVFDATGVAQVSDVYQAILFATDQGANVINMSFGASDASQALSDAIAYATANQVVTVGASGNNNLQQVLYPANIAPAIAVAATDNGDLKASFSNFAPNMFVSAPGVNLWAAYPNHLLTLASGTSYATPLVAGQAALIFGQYFATYRGTPTINQVQSRIKYGADTIDALQPAFAGQLGSGRINLVRSLSMLSATSGY